MKTVKILINDIDKVKSLVNTTAKYSNDFDLRRGRYVIDAKSILGVFSLDISQPVYLDIHTTCEKDLNMILMDMSKFIVE